MALSKDNVEKAWRILNAINRDAKNSFILDAQDPADTEKENTIIGFGKMSDGGWENVFMNVRNITYTQLQLFEQRKKEVDNSAFTETVRGGLTRIGWF